MVLHHIIHVQYLDLTAQISSTSILGWWEGLRNLECRPGSGGDLLKSVPMLSGLGNYQFIPREGFQGPQGEPTLMSGRGGGGWTWLSVKTRVSNVSVVAGLWLASCWPSPASDWSVPGLMSRLSGLGSQVVINKLQPCSAGQLVASQSTEDKTPRKLIWMECWSILWITGGGGFEDVPL